VCMCVAIFQTNGLVGLGDEEGVGGRHDAEWVARVFVRALARSSEPTAVRSGAGRRISRGKTDRRRSTAVGSGRRQQPLVLLSDDGTPSRGRHRCFENGTRGDVLNANCDDPPPSMPRTRSIHPIADSARSRRLDTKSCGVRVWDG